MSCKALSVSAIWPSLTSRIMSILLLKPTCLLCWIYFAIEASSYSERSSMPFAFLSSGLHISLKFLRSSYGNGVWSPTLSNASSSLSPRKAVINNWFRTKLLDSKTAYDCSPLEFISSEISLSSTTKPLSSLANTKDALGLVSLKTFGMIDDSDIGSDYCNFCSI